VADRQNLSADDPVNRRNPATSTKSKSKFTEQRLLYPTHGELVKMEKAIAVAKEKHNAYLKELGLSPLP
jgi:hypothetical protein